MVFVPAGKKMTHELDGVKKHEMELFFGTNMKCKFRKLTISLHKLFHINSRISGPSPISDREVRIR
jgi:hypothetical protein